MRPEPHVPAVARRWDGWAVYCIACSREADDYTQCRRAPDDWPPPQLAEEAMVRAKAADAIAEGVDRIGIRIDADELAELQDFVRGDGHA